MIFMIKGLPGWDAIFMMEMINYGNQNNPSNHGSDNFEPIFPSSSARQVSYPTTVMKVRYLENSIPDAFKYSVELQSFHLFIALLLDTSDYRDTFLSNFIDNGKNGYRYTNHS